MTILKPSLKGVLVYPTIALIFSILVIGAIFLYSFTPRNSSIRTDPSFGYFILLVIAVIAVMSALLILQMKFTSYSITPDGIKIESTFLSAAVQITSFDKINSIEINQNIFERAIKTGSVSVITSSGQEVVLSSLPNPHGTADLIQRMKDNGK